MALALQAARDGAAHGMALPARRFAEGVDGRAVRRLEQRDDGRKLAGAAGGLRRIDREGQGGAGQCFGRGVLLRAGLRTCSFCDAAA